jgi:hypothetical protein
MWIYTHLSGKRNQVMLAETENLNVLHDDELIVIFVEDGAVNNVSQVLLVAFGKVHHSFCITFGGAPESFSMRAAACSGVDSSLSRVPVPIHGSGKRNAMGFS